MPGTLTIWTNTRLAEPAHRLLVESLEPHRLVTSRPSSDSLLAEGSPDPALARADIAFGQPHVESCINNPRLRWIEVTTAGFTRYDREDFREALRQRDGILTNSSSVFAEPCAQHALAMMLAGARQLLPAYKNQLCDQEWPHLPLRAASRLLNGQTALLLGYGAIGRRIAELLAPFRMKLYAVRRKTYSEPGVHIIPEERLSSIIAQADHIINVLPENASTPNYVNARRLGWCKRGAHFYNVGRGSTVDQDALAEALGSGRLAAAWLDVTAPEPLPRGHPLWHTPNCFITPHAAGGRHDQDEALVRHFLANLPAFLEADGETRWLDRVM